MRRILTITILVLAVSEIVKSECNRGCMMCESNRCRICFKRKVTNGRCDDEEVSAEDKCLVYGDKDTIPNLGPGGCIRCMKGIQLDTLGSCNTINDGVRLSERCIKAVNLGSGVNCLVCENSHPTSDLGGCSPVVSSSDEKCLWWTLNSGGRPICSRCKPGFKLNLKYFSCDTSYGGCSMYDHFTKICKGCHTQVEDGRSYYMSYPGVCTLM